MSMHIIQFQKKTKLELEKITNKPIYFLPLWVNQNIWFFIQEKKSIERKIWF